MDYLAIFRSCLRKEYADQVIKMLRATEGEQTRTSYRLDWVSDEALSLLNADTNPLCIASITNRNATHALPSRILTVLEHSIDNDSGVVRLLFEIGPFILVDDNFNGEIDSWGIKSSERPPSKFISIYKSDWPKFTEARSNALVSWRRAVDFATTNWDFKNTVFLRPVDSNLEGREREIHLKVNQATSHKFEIASYNPHLTDVDLSRKQIHVTTSGAMAEIVQSPFISRDGVMPVEFKYLEPGTSKIEIHVQPDPQFSTYIPIGVEIKADPELDPVGPRLLGSEWSSCLDSLNQIFSKDTDLQLNVLKTLSSAFPNEPELMLRRGHLHLMRGENLIAADMFKEVLGVRESARGIAWLLIASLRIGAVRESEELLQRLNLSENALFQQIVEAASGIDEQTVMRFVDLPGMYLSEDKAIKLVQALGDSTVSQDAAQMVMSALVQLDNLQALNFAKKCLNTNPEWRNLRRDYVLLAYKLNNLEAVKNHAGLILRYENEDPSDLTERIERLGVHVHPVELLGILLYNAGALTVENSEGHRLACLDQSMRAAELAFALCDYSAADQALHILSKNLRLNDAQSIGYLTAAKQIGLSISNSRKELIDLTQSNSSYHDLLLQNLTSHLSGKTLVIFGGSEEQLLLEHWKDSTGLRHIELVSENSSTLINDRQLLEIKPSELVVVVSWLNSLVFSEQVELWLEENNVPICRSFFTSESILHSLVRRLITKNNSAQPQQFNKPSEVVAFARLNMKNLVINPDLDKTAAELDSYPLAKAWARKMVRSLEALSEYCEWRSERNVGGVNFLTWLGRNDSIPPNWVSMKESEGLESNPVHYRQRMFPVDSSVDPSGSIFMEAHVKIDFDHPAPRIHFFDASGLDIKKIYIGYIGEHLPTPSGH
jgi:hypothetical protein